MEQFRAFASGPAGQKLLKMMQEKNGSALQAAALHASRGDAQKAKAELTSLLSDPEVRAILEQASAGNMQGAKAALGSILNDPQAQSLLRKLKDDANG